MAKKQQESSPTPVLSIGSVVAAFSEEQVEQITGLSRGRLRYWAKTDFFKPSFVEDNPRLPYSRFYSFRDIVALRTLEMLRVQNNVPLQHLRKVAEKLAHLEDDLWVKTTLYVANKKVVMVNPEARTPEEVVSGQYLLGIPLSRVIRDTSADIVKFSKRKKESIGHLSQSRAIVRNAWVIAGTRIPVGAIKRLSEDGYSIPQIIAEYPDLTKQDVEAALRHEKTQAA